MAANVEDTMLLEGSCHCGAVRFEVESSHPYPYNLCYCETCRKTAGAGGYSINLSGRASTLTVEGAEYIRVYRPGHMDEKTGDISPQERRFCEVCGSALWIQDPRWPDLVHPHASAIDNNLPVPPERTHMMLAHKANWVEVRADEQDQLFDEYPRESIAQWHERLGLTTS
jgi:hypothetical protein